jgi:O-acetyl-ADP-ribose deacetylase (regulator of RNase III)
MTLTFLTTGSIFDCGADAVVVPVNCVGVAGKGVALEAKKRWPTWYEAYKWVCNHGMPAPGEMWAYDREAVQVPLPRYVLSAATKGHWRSKSSLLDVGQCLANIRAWALRVQPATLALPALGCGLGGLAWSTVKPMVERCFDMAQFQGDLVLNTRVLVFEPQ